MPRIDDLIDRTGRAKFISTIDLTRSYWQVPLAKGARTRSAFATPFGLFQFTVMPFGLQGAPATFQRLMDRVIRGLGEFSAAYMDGVIIFSESWEEHLKHLRAVLDRLREAGLTTKTKKINVSWACHIVYTSVTLLDTKRCSLNTPRFQRSARWTSLKPRKKYGPSSD